MIGGADLIRAFVAGRYSDPATGRPVHCPIRVVAIENSLDGAEAELVARAGLAGTLAVVADPATHAALGARVQRALRGSRSIVLAQPRSDAETVAALRDRVGFADGLVAVGSGTLNDLVKAVAHATGRPAAVFATAASMNGYTTSTVSLTRGGFKVSEKATAPVGVFFDLDVLLAAPPRLAAAGLGDSLCRSPAQIDWRLADRLLGTGYSETPFDLQKADEPALLRGAAGLRAGDRAAMRALVHILVLTGLGVCVTGTSHHGSMGEHLISHYVDMLARPHPGTLHGEQVGVASLVMRRLQDRVLRAEHPPKLRPLPIDTDALRRRYGPAAEACAAELAAKALDGAACDRLNTWLEAHWQELRTELAEVAIPPDVLRSVLAAAGAPTSGAELGLPAPFWREAIRHAREVRNRFSMLDIAAHARLLDDFVAGEG